MGYIDPTKPDTDSGNRAQIHRDKAEADDLARQVLFSGTSTYRGSPKALRRTAARAGKPLPKTTKGD
ncbi:hypothetical protein ASG73_10300 [Janibacter sp. Soil728]|nr:hypothetical protein ASG73_10300 [Janibacter sp. Soil728]